MLSLLRRQCASRPCLRSLPRPVLSSPNRVPQRALATVVETDEDFRAQLEELQAELEAADQDGDAEGPSEGPAGGGIETYADFMSTIGHQFKYSQPNHWLGGRVVEYRFLPTRSSGTNDLLSSCQPFPMNPSFKPPPPLSDAQKHAIWKLYQLNPTKRTIRSLSKQMNISLKRVSAILRLKQFEQQYIKGKTLQSGFAVGMEYLLQAQEHPSIKDIDLSDAQTRPEVPVLAQHSDMHQADALEQAENRDSSRLQYERLYWESIPEHHLEPTMPTLLHHAKRLAEYKALTEQAKRNARFVAKVRQTPFIKRPKQSIITLRREGKPTTQFIDVGARYVDAKEQSKRMAMSERRASIKAKKHAEATAQAASPARQAS